MPRTTNNVIHATFNGWFTSLPEGRQKVLREDKWAMAEAAFDYARGLDSKSSLSAVDKRVAHVQVGADVYEVWISTLPDVHTHRVFKNTRCVVDSAHGYVGVLCALAGMFPTGFDSVKGQHSYVCKQLVTVLPIPERPDFLQYFQPEMFVRSNEIASKYAEIQKDL